ncbi:MAG: hypothetical protein IPJ88_07940 [Myxococcales bacterium]|nr:MAG: hypothetical protein IPJ88_07940 [Myxococcales bacterium]
MNQSFPNGAWACINVAGGVVLLETMSLRQMIQAVFLAALVLAIACPSCQRSKTKALDEASVPFLDRFSEFDRWVRHAAEGEGGFGDDGAFSEALFSKLRGDSQVLAAWVLRPDADRSVLAFPKAQELPKTLRWTRLRKQSFDELLVSPWQLRTASSNQGIPGLLISHRRKESHQTTVIVAYRLDLE